MEDMMTKPNPTYLSLPDRTRRMAKMAAVRFGMSLSEYVQTVIEEDCSRSGIASMVEQDEHARLERPAQPGQPGQ